MLEVTLTLLTIVVLVALTVVLITKVALAPFVRLKPYQEQLSALKVPAEMLTRPTLINSLGITSSTVTFTAVLGP